LAEEKDEKKSEQRPSARKVKDKWRAKEWYKVISPDMFGGQQIAETVSADPSLLQGRVISVALQDITGDFSKMHIKLNLRINRVAGFEAHTEFVGHDITSDYIRRLTRRKHSKMDGVFEARTKDGYTIKVKPMAITEKRIQTSQQKAIRHLMSTVVSAAAGRQTLSELVKDVLSGDMAKLIFKECKPVYPIRKIEIRRTQITDMPEPSEMPATAPAEGAPAEGAAAAPAAPAEGAPPAPPAPSPAPSSSPPAPAPKPARAPEELPDEEE
jgi:small subunit ribosomal protein S3Ae